ncbi:tRNA (32-2'-O)-methyltransferase regulator THADA isoform X2 [Hyperolius riggenbachi]|uniref:tRNA (32-2'-O)-methyltransferase regulator THADA isoform X2 n=1 Tax=Hyperolius riggenbachi TaxID=752182 RepID=UPI0035A2D4C9
MVLKKKKEVKVDILKLDGQSLDHLKSLASGEGGGLSSHLLQCLQLQDGVQQIHSIRKVLPLLENLDGSSGGTEELSCCMAVLAEMYFAASMKNPLKKVLASAISSIPDPCKEDAICAFTASLRKEVATADPENYRNVVDNLTACMDGFSLGSSCVISLLPEALRFLVKVLHLLQSQNKKVLGDGLAQTQLMHDLLTAVKLAMVLLQRSPESVKDSLISNPQSLLWKVMCDLLRCFTDMLLDDDLLQNVQSTSGMAIILYLKTMIRDCEKLTKLVGDLVLLSLDSADVPDWFMQCCGPLCQGLSDIARLFLCQGALAMLDWRESSLSPGAETLLLNLLKVLLSLSSHLKESSAALFLSRILALWTNSALELLQSCSRDLQESLNGSSSAISRLLEYVYIHWEHPLDAVRHQAKQIFKNILQIHHAAGVVVSSGEVDVFLSELTHKLLNLEWHSKGKYASLACLVECVGTEQILSVDRTIPEQILDVMWDQSFAPYAANLLEAMFVNHKKQLVSGQESCWGERWHGVWVSPLLKRLCEEDVTQTTYIIDYYLPKLLKCNPESLNYMVDHLQSSAGTSVGSGNNRGALGALMACLRAARSHGHLRFTDKYAWSGRVSTALIQQGLVHRHDQIRMDALGLLCESHWSTEVVSLDEMDLVRFFLKYNLNCQSPSVRQQLCYLIKKLFCRVQESSQVLYKHQQIRSLRGAPLADDEGDPCTALQHYTEFMSSVTDYLFGSLFPGSSHPTRFSALTILGSIAEIFPVVAGSCQSVFQFAQSVSGNNVHALLECFSNTFEEVKLLAFELLRKLPPSVLGLQDSEKLPELFRAAMQLSTSTKHFDCVTASYVLKFLIYQEGLEAVLGDCVPEAQEVPGQLTSHIDSTSFVEKNAYAVIRMLLNSLEREIVQAENSLLEAAASFPLYGRVHCIIGALELVSLGNVSAVEEWRQMVSRLIAASYRLSAIVSPVVHSSSPEGLMPMDTESEAAAQLHMIMSEIKPRDTNDYFSQPRILQKDSDLHSQALPEDRVPSTTLCAEMKGDEGTSCSVTAQMVLVCCWRSMKEVSLLLGFLCQNLPLQTQLDSPRGLITVQQVKEMGEYFKHHLLQSRHRGAFELAYVGFVKLTGMLIGCEEESLRGLPRLWLCNVLEEIKSSDPSSRLCATRRSAGIPFYIQVHALNILRAIFRDTRLGENVIPYVGEGTQAAILGFTSPVWAVRNSSTLLFSTLITRIFGVKRGKDERSKKNRMTGREFFSRFPVLYPFLLEQLESVADTVDSPTGESKLHPSLYLLLLILSKLYPSPMDGTYSALSMAPFIPFLIRCANSPVYRSREMAARALIPFVMADDIPRTAVGLLQSLPDSGSHLVRQNHVHGALLQVSHLLQSFFEAKHTVNSERIQQEVRDITNNLKAKLWLAKRQNPCLLTRAAYVDILTTVSNYLRRDRLQGSGFWEDVCSVVEDCELLEGTKHTASAPGLVLYMQSSAHLILSVLNQGQGRHLPWRGGARSPSSVLQRMLGSEFYEVRLLTLESVLRCMKHGGGEIGGAPPSPGLDRTLCEMMMKERNVECLCQVMKILYEMNIEELLLTAKQEFQVEPRDFLRRLIDLVAGVGHSVEIQSSALKLSSRLAVSLAGNETEASESPLKDWVTLVVQCCGDELQVEVKLAAAEVLVDVTPHLLANPPPALGVADTLQLWMCILRLLQSEDSDVRDAAVDIVRVYNTQKSSLSGTGFTFCTVSPPMALDLTLGIVRELLQRWDQVPAGVTILLEWLLGEDDLSDLESVKPVEEDYLFEKGEANFWAEKLVYVRLLDRHVRELINTTRYSIPLDATLLQISQRAGDRSERLQHLLNDLPPTPQFLKTTEYTRLLIHKERASRCTDILQLLNSGKES